ncbi:caspase family protein [Tropicimonas sp. IMCC6043]|uniref:caspase family protein n=1 Tax=Tropicimonas sp. IMCC6043 TaxID=2510645 RepID=UPI00101C9252|nr:caspase family protein [Tropicimonas sp. IMCC6043]RYH11547.1 peptidase C14, caspase catalytic subunit p20 [Tropicimonas sp. IMCC6043]
MSHTARFRLASGASRIALLVCGLAVAGLPASADLRQVTRADTGRAVPGRVAIVVGNQDYDSVPDLGNARRDAEDMAAMLRSFRFNVFDGYDLDKREFEELLRTAMLNITEGADVVFYYAGHGIQIGRRNYLLPTDAAFASIYDVPLETMTLDRVIETLAARGATHVAILDSCRDNPFPDIRLAADLDANLFETKSGFDVFSTPLNSFVAFSTSPGAVAMDGDVGGNSPYTSAIINAVGTTPGENIQNLFPRVREQVYSATQGKQVPWESSTLVRPFYLIPAVARPEAQTAPAEGETVSPDRGMVLASPANGPISLEPVSIRIEKPFDRRVDIADLFQARLDVPFQDAELVTPPDSGILSVGETPSGGPRIIYSPQISDIRATSLDDYSVSDQFAVNIEHPDGSERRVDVALDLTVDPCDLEAGDALDLGGVGIYRLPNEIDLLAALSACEAAVERDPENARFRYQLGRVQQGLGRLEQAFANFEAASEGGHLRALHALSVLFSTDQIDREATGIPENQELARELLERGTSLGDPYPMHRLGKQLLNNGETEAERQRGFELLESALELGHTYSMNELGIYFLNKDSDHYIPERGMRYLRASEAREDIYGYANLAFVAVRGLDGNPPDFQTAFDYYKKASEGGHPSAPSSIARMILRGQLGAKDVPEAVRWYDIGLERGDGWGGTNAAVLILNDDVPGKGGAEAAVRAAKAANLSNEEAAAKARELLGDIPASELGMALQMLLKELGQQVTVDGAVGPQTLQALERASQEAGIAYRAANDPRERLLFAGRVYWAQNPVRFDLF